MKKLLGSVFVVTVLLALLAAPVFAQVPDFGTLGFTQVLASQQVAPGTETTVSGGPFSVLLPAGTFTDTVKFEILSAPLSAVQAKAPAGQTPELDFAFRVTDVATGQLIGAFQKTATFTATSNLITADSKYYVYTTAGDYIEAPQGLSVKAGELVHPVNTAAVAWVITSPSVTATATPTATATATPTAAATPTTTTPTPTPSPTPTSAPALPQTGDPGPMAGYGQLLGVGLVLILLGSLTLVWRGNRLRR